jgi:hypothetical protein
MPSRKEASGVVAKMIADTRDAFALSSSNQPTVGDPVLLLLRVFPRPFPLGRAD